MDGNDISAFTTSRQAVVWEGLLATPKPGRYAEFQRSRCLKSERWDVWLSLWVPRELPLKSMIDQHNRLGIATDVYTFTHWGVVDAIEDWLARKGASCRVFFYTDTTELLGDLRFNRSIKRVLTADQDTAADIGIRAMCTTPDKAWS